MIYTFHNNSAILDYGFKVDIKPNTIANLDDPNCQTPVVPPTINGCGFALDLQKINLPAGGVLYRYITLETEAMSGDQKIQIDLKDYEKGEIIQNIGIVNAQPNSKKIFLPASIPSSQSLYFRFWTSKGVVKIKKILIDYLSIQNLKPVEIRLESTLQGKKTASIFQDLDEDGKYTANKDRIWECSSGFPGVAPIDLQNKKIIELVRDDSCMTEPKPESWKNDLGLAVLPPGKWLLVVDDKNFTTFEVKPVETKQSFDLKL